MVEKKRAAKEASSLDESGIDKDTLSLNDAESFLSLDDNIKEVKRSASQTCAWSAAPRVYLRRWTTSCCPLSWGKRAPATSPRFRPRSRFYRWPTKTTPAARWRRASSTRAVKPPTFEFCSNTFRAPVVPPRCFIFAVRATGALLLPFLRLPSHMLDVLPSYGSEALSRPYRFAKSSPSNDATKGGISSWAAMAIRLC